MTSTTLRIALLASAFSLVACGNGEDDGPDPPGPPTFTRVTQEVITQKGCGGPLCHSLGAGGFRLGSKAALHTELVGKQAGGAFCGPNAGMGDGGAEGGAEGGTEGGVPEAAPAPVYIRVVPGEPEESLLYLKIRGAPPCGDPMPPSATPLSSAQIQLVHDWIEAGAQND